MLPGKAESGAASQDAALDELAAALRTSSGDSAVLGLAGETVADRLTSDVKRAEECADRLQMDANLIHERQGKFNTILADARARGEEVADSMVGDPKQLNPFDRGKQTEAADRAQRKGQGVGTGFGQKIALASPHQKCVGCPFGGTRRALTWLACKSC